MTANGTQATPQHAAWSKYSARILAPLMTVGAIAVLWTLPYVVSSYYVGLLTQVLILGLWAMSLNVLAGQTGLISLGHAATLGVAAYTSAYLQTEMDVGFIVASAAAVAAACLVSAVFALTAARSSEVYFILVTLAQGMLVWGMVQRWVAVTGGDNGLRVSAPPGVLATSYGYYWLTLILSSVAILALWYLQRSNMGRTFRGLRESSLRMSSIGYSVQKIRFQSYMLSGATAGLAGALYIGHFRYVSPSMVHVGASVEVLLMVVIGGMSVFMGPLLGAFVLVFGRSWVTEWTSHWHLVMGAVLVLMVLVAPDGILGRLRQVALGRRRKSSRPPGAAPSSGASDD